MERAVALQSGEDPVLHGQRPEGLLYAQRRGITRCDLERVAHRLRTEREGGAEKELSSNASAKRSLDVGLLVEPDDGRAPYDRFRHRLTIPIVDARGRIIAFGARALDAATEPKYLNSPETKLSTRARPCSISPAPAEPPSTRASSSWSKATWTSSPCIRRAACPGDDARHGLHRAPDGSVFGWSRRSRSSASTATAPAKLPRRAPSTACCQICARDTLRFRVPAARRRTPTTSCAIRARALSHAVSPRRGP